MILESIKKKMTPVKRCIFYARNIPTKKFREIKKFMRENGLSGAMFLVLVWETYKKVNRL